MATSPKRVLIIGATSAIAQATARAWAAERGTSFHLISRNQSKLAPVAQDLVVRGAAVTCEAVDLDACDNHPALLERSAAAMGGIDAVLIAHGVLGDQEEAQKSFAACAAVMRTNLLSTLSLLTWLANYFEERKAGCIAVISSVAGDRGRGSNYVYGTSKAGVDAFLGGLRNRLHHAGIQVLTVKPGFVDTPMTSAIAKNALFASPDRVGADICRAVRRRADIVYTPWFWRWVMLAVRVLPQVVFKRLRL